MDTKEWRRSFWHGAAMADRSVSVWTKCGSGLERFHPEPLSSTWAAGPGFRLPRFWSVKALAPLALMQHHLSFRLSSVISRTHPSFARRCRIRDSSIALSMVPWHGDSCSCFPPKTSAALSKRSPGYWCPGAGCCLRLPLEPIVWNDAMTGLESCSLGATEYRRHMPAVGLSVASEYEDEGKNHYFDAFKDEHYPANSQ